jgi:ATP-dependent RNA helicase DDX54/DBP10
LHEILNKAGFSSVTIYGTMDQTARKINIGKFRTGASKFLIVTDVAARGIGMWNPIQVDFVKMFRYWIM